MTTFKKSYKDCFSIEGSSQGVTVGLTVVPTHGSLGPNQPVADVKAGLIPDPVLCRKTQSEGMSRKARRAEQQKIQVPVLLDEDQGEVFSDLTSFRKFHFDDGTNMYIPDYQHVGENTGCSLLDTLTHKRTKEQVSLYLLGFVPENRPIVDYKATYLYCKLKKEEHAHFSYDLNKYSQIEKKIKSMNAGYYHGRSKEYKIREYMSERNCGVLEAIVEYYCILHDVDIRFVETTMRSTRTIPFNSLYELQSEEPCVEEFLSDEQLLAVPSYIEPTLLEVNQPLFTPEPMEIEENIMDLDIEAQELIESYPQIIEESILNLYSPEYFEEQEEEVFIDPAIVSYQEPIICDLPELEEMERINPLVKNVFVDFTEKQNKYSVVEIEESILDHVRINTPKFLHKKLDKFLSEITYIGPIREKRIPTKNLISAIPLAVDYVINTRKVTNTISNFGEQGWVKKPKKVRFSPNIVSESPLVFEVPHYNTRFEELYHSILNQTPEEVSMDEEAQQYWKNFEKAIKIKITKAKNELNFLKQSRKFIKRSRTKFVRTPERKLEFKNIMKQTYDEITHKHFKSEKRYDQLKHFSVKHFVPEYNRSRHSAYFEEGVTQSMFMPTEMKKSMNDSVLEIKNNITENLNTTFANVNDTMLQATSSLQVLLQEKIRSLNFSEIAGDLKKEMLGKMPASSLDEVIMDIIFLLLDLVTLVYTKESLTVGTMIAHMARTLVKYISGAVHEMVYAQIQKFVAFCKRKFCSDAHGDTESKDEDKSTRKFFKMIESIIDNKILGVGRLSKTAKLITDLDTFSTKGVHFSLYIMDVIQRIYQYIYNRVHGLTDQDIMTQAHKSMSEWLIDYSDVLHYFRVFDDDETPRIKATFTPNEMLAKLTRTYKNGNAIKKDIIKINNANLQRLFSDYLKNVTEIYLSNVGVVGSKHQRHEPIVMALVGAPGVGKTTLFKSLYQDFRALMGIDIRNVDTHIYINSQVSEYHDTYIGQEVFVFEDMYQFRDPQPIIQENTLLNQIKGRQPYRMNCAQIENKTNTYFTSKFVLATMNAVPTVPVVSMNGALLLNPQSALRRFDIIVELHPIDEFKGVQDPISGCNEFKKLPMEYKDRKSMLKFKICNMKDANGGGVYDYDGLVRYLSEFSKKHEAIQESMDIADALPSKYLEEGLASKVIHGETQSKFTDFLKMSYRAVAPPFKEALSILRPQERKKKMELNPYQIPGAHYAQDDETEGVGFYFAEDKFEYEQIEQQVSYMMNGEPISQELRIALVASLNKIYSQSQEYSLQSIAYEDIIDIIESIEHEMRKSLVPLHTKERIQHHLLIGDFTHVMVALGLIFKNRVVDRDIFETYVNTVLLLGLDVENSLIAKVYMVSMGLGYCEVNDDLIFYYSGSVQFYTYDQVRQHIADFISLRVEERRKCLIDGTLRRALMSSQTKYTEIKFNEEKYLTPISAHEYLKNIVIERNIRHNMALKNYLNMNMSFVLPTFLNNENKVRLFLDNMLTMCILPCQYRSVKPEISMAQRLLFGNKITIDHVIEHKENIFKLFFNSLNYEVSRLIPKRVKDAYDYVTNFCQENLVIMQGAYWKTIKENILPILGSIAAILIPVSVVIGAICKRDAIADLNDKILDKCGVTNKTARKVLNPLSKRSNKETESMHLKSLRAKVSKRAKTFESEIVNEPISAEQLSLLQAYASQKLDEEGDIVPTFEEGDTEAYSDPNCVDLSRKLKAASFKIWNITGRNSACGYIYHDCVLYCNSHLIPDEDHEILIGGNIRHQELTEKPIKLKNFPYYRFKDCDVLAIDLHSLLHVPYADLTKHIVKAEDFTKGAINNILFSPPRYVKDQLFVKDELEPYMNTVGTDVDFYKGELRLDDANLGRIVLYSALKAKYLSQAGDCGVPLLIYNPAYPRKICAIHTAGSKVSQGYGYSCLLTQDMVQVVKTHINPKTESLKYPVVSPYVESVVVRPDDPIEIVGSLVGDYAIRTPSKTKLRQTCLYNQVYETQVAPAAMNNKNGVDPLRNGIIQNFCGDKPFNLEILEYSTRQVESHLLSFDSTQFKTGLLSERENINGVFGSNTIEAINLTSSMGYPFSHVKGVKGKKFVLEVFEDGHYMLDDKMRSLISSQEDMLKKGKMITTMFIDTKKDEKRDLEKVKFGNTRIFQNCDFMSNFLLRKYFQAFISHLQENCVESPVAVGINPHSSDWMKLYRRLTSNSSNFIAGDYKKYDKKLPMILFIKATEIVNNFYKDEHSRTRMLLVKSFVSGFHICDNTVYRAHHGMPSGCVLTSTYNSVINCILMHYCYSVSLNMHISDPSLRWMFKSRFFDLVQTTFYGDDHVLTANNSIALWFNMKTIQAILQDLGMTYTTNTKEEIITPFICQDQLSFLCRKFRVDCGRVFAPLEFSSLIELWNWTHVGSDSDEDLLENIEMFFLEMSHYTRKTFCEVQSYCRDRCNDLGFPIPLYDYYECQNKQSGESHGVTQADSVDDPEPTTAFDKSREVTELGITRFTDQAEKKQSWFFKLFRPPDLTNPYAEPTIRDFISRPYVLSVLDWSPASTGVIYETTFPYALFSLPTIWDKLKNFELFRCDGVNFEVRVNGTNFHYGDLLVTNVVQYWNGLSKGGSTPCQFDNMYALFPNATIVNANNDIVNTINLPYINFKQYINLSEFNKVPGTSPNEEQMITEFARIRLVVLNPILPTTARVTITANFINPHIAGNGLGRADYVGGTLPLAQFSTVEPNGYTYRGPVTFEEGETQAEMMDDISEASKKNTGASISSNLAKVSKIGGMFSVVPGPVGLASVITSTVCGIGSFLAKAFGYHKPIDIQNRRAIILHGFNTALSRGLDYSNILGIDPENQVGSLAAAMGGSMGDMVIHEQIIKYGLLTRMTLPATLGPGAKFFEIGVHPLIVPSLLLSSHEVVYHTPLSYYAACVAFWRGSLKYRMRICCSNFHTVRIRIAWYPGEIPAMTDAQRYREETNVVSHIVDVRSTTEFEFTVPFLRDLLYLSNLTVRTTTSFNNFLRTVGNLSFSIINPILHPQVPIPPVYFNLMVAAGDDMCFFKPTGIRLSNSPGTYVALSDEEKRSLGMIVYHDDEGYESDDDYESSHGVTQSQPEALVSTTRPVIPKNICFGEDLIHVKDLIMREGITLIPSANQQISVNTRFSFPDQVVDRSFFQYFQRYYRFWRGTIQYTIFGSTPGEVTAYTFVKGSPDTSTARYEQFTIPLNTSIQNLPEGLYFAPQSPISFNPIGVAVPYYYYNMFMPTVNMNSSCFYENNIEVRINLPGTNANRWLSERASDDFEFGLTLGAPTLNYSINEFIYQRP